MLKFFRKYRQKLLAAGRLSKYLLYAIGEIILVVIGILIALQINNWNEERKESITERLVLEDLRDNIARNNQLIESTLEIFDQIDKSTHIVKTVFNTKSHYSDSLSFHFSQSVRHGGFRLRLNADGYESFKNTGFGIIRNEKLKGEILRLFEVTYANYQTELEWANASYIGFYGWWDDYFFTTEKDFLIPLDFDQIVSSKAFIGKINETMIIRESLKIAMMDCLNHNTAVLKLINDELE